MKVIHICGESAVGKKYLLNRIREIEVKSGTYSLTKYERSLLNRFEIKEPFTVLNPVGEEWKTTLSQLKECIKRLFANDRHETLVHHWQYTSQSIFYLLNQLDPDISQKIFLIWRNPEHHLRDLHARPGEFGESWDENCLKKLFVNLYDSLHPVKMTQKGYDDLKRQCPGNVIPDSDIEMYQNELDIEIDVLVNTSDANEAPKYHTITGDKLACLIQE